MYEIYSIGDSAFLFAVLNAVAALAQSDEYQVMAKIGLMLGVLFVVGRGALSGGTQLPVGSLLGCMLLYMGFFGPTRDVAITDVYTQQVRTVSHVPLGIAFAGSQVSLMGYQVTQLMEQAFSTPRMTEQGYGAALETIKRVRLATISLYDLNLMNEPTAGADLPRSWQQYIADCPLKGVQNENRLKDVAAIFNQPLLGDGLRFASDVWGTRLDLARPYTEPTCSEAFEQLVDYTTTSFLPYFKQVMAKKLGYPDPVALETALEASLAALGLTNTTDEFLATSALSAIYFSALRQRYGEDFQPAYATAVDDAVRQRNAQWLADESVFQQYMRPMITFLEAFIYAMTPFLVLLLGLGSYGINVIIGFLTTLIWITTWMPVLAIINFFEHYVAAAKLSALAGTGGVATMAGLFEADSIVQTYLAVGGNMAAAVPALTASFLFIGARAFGANLFAGRLSSGDTFKEEKAAPDSYHAPAMVSYDSGFTYTQTGAHTGITGAARIAPTYSWGEASQEAVSAAERRIQSVGHSFVESVGKRLAETAGRNESGSLAQSFSDGSTAGKSNSFATASAWAASFDKGATGTSGLNDDQRANVALGVSLGVPLGKLAELIGLPGDRIADPSIRGGVSQTSADFHSRVERLGASMQDSMRNDHQYQVQFASALATDMTQRHETGVFAGTSLQGDRGLQRQASEVLSASRDFGRVVSASSELGNRSAIAEPDLVGLLKRYPEVRGYLGREVMDNGLIGSAHDIESGIRFIYPEQRDAQIAGELRAMEHNGSEVERRLFFAGLGQRLLLARAHEYGDPQAAAGLAHDVPGAGEVRDRVEAMAGFDGGFGRGVHRELGERADAVTDGSDSTAHRAMENNADVETHQATQKQDGQDRYGFESELAKDFGSSPNLATGLQGAHGFLVEKVQQLGDLLENPFPLEGPIVRDPSLQPLGVGEGEAPK